MPQVNATILIPDISGFTQFITGTELMHGSLAINFLIDSIVNAVGDEYEVSEIEGDAVLMIRRGPAPTKPEISETCQKIFQAFHFQRKWMQLHMICPCKACTDIDNLTLKFVAHYGPLAEIKVGRFIKQSGLEMIVAHRLLKNSIENNEYLLMTNKMLENTDDLTEVPEMNWSSASEVFDSIGEVKYQFALLGQARKNVPDPPIPNNSYRSDDTVYHEIHIGANYRNAYMTLMNIPNRHSWCPGLLKVEQDMPAVFKGSVHRCSFENFQVTISPLDVVFSDKDLLYIETCMIQPSEHHLVHEFRFQDLGNNQCKLLARCMNNGENPVPEQIRETLHECMIHMMQGLKNYCENPENIEELR